MIVDDEESARAMLRNFLAKRKCDIVEAENGLAALKILETHPVDVIISDISMPVLDGLGLLKAAKEQCPDIEVILVTAYQDMENAVEAVRGHAYDFIRKPFDLAAVHRVIQHIAAEKHLQRELEMNKEQLRKSRWISALGVLAAGVMHEINNPNAVISGNAEYLRSKILPRLERADESAADAGALIDDLRKVINGIIRGSERITEIVRRSTVIDASNGEDGKVVDIRDAIIEAMSEAALTADSGVRWTKVLPEQPVMISGCRNMLTQAIGPLLSNAVEAIRESEVKEIRVHLSVGDAASVTVEDTGPGMAESLQGQIFAPFATTKRDRPGRGLGLFIAEQIVNVLQGTLRYERKDERTVFSIQLPVSTTSIAPPLS